MEESYELLDCGDQSKLERFGEVVLQRPSPQSLWNPRAPHLWDRADAVYHRSAEGGGSWQRKRSFPEPWWVEMDGVKLRLQTTGFGHVGVFPEQLPFWKWIRAQCRGADRPLRLLNLFAYTGGASIAAAQGGAEVTHCDSSKGIVQWASENARANGFPTAGGSSSTAGDSSAPSKTQPESAPKRAAASSPEGHIRWIVDDAVKFVAREFRRQRHYDALILDPPSFGRGPKGQVWKLERDLRVFLDELVKLITDDFAFVLLSAHTPGVGPLALYRLLAGALERRPGAAGIAGALHCGEMTIPETGGRSAAVETGMPALSTRVLPSGTWAAWSGRGNHPKPVLPSPSSRAAADDSTPQSGSNSS